MPAPDITFKWKRPDEIEFPKVWHTFKARDLHSEDLVEYRIEDVTQSNAKDVFIHMKKFYIQDEPVGQALGAASDDLFYEDYVRAWSKMIEQKVPLVCYKSGSDEVVGVNFNFIMSKEDHFTEKYVLTLKSSAMRNFFGLIHLLYEDFDPFEYYGVDDYMGSFGLSVDRKYRGRNIGDHFLATRKLLCAEYGLKFTHTIFTSDFSNKNADRAGFVSNVVLKYEDIVERHPEYSLLKNIKSSQLTLKTLLIHH